MDACWSEGPLMHRNLLRMGEAIFCSARLQAREVGLPGGSVCISSPLARVVLKGGGWGNSNFRIKTTGFPLTLRRESGTINQNLGFGVFVIVFFARLFLLH